MSVQVVQTSEIDTSKRYTEQERDAAYFLWRTTAGRSCRKVASHLGINERTIYNWRDTHDWVLRANQDDHDDYGSSRIGVTAIVINQTVPSILEAVRIRDHGTDDKVRLAAAQWLAGLAGVSPVSKIETSVVQAPNQSDIVDVQSLTNMSPEELMKLEQETRSKRKPG